MHDSLALLIIEITYDLSCCDQQAMQRIARSVAGVVPHGPVAVAHFAASAELDPGAVEFARADQEDARRGALRAAVTPCCSLKHRYAEHADARPKREPADDSRATGVKKLDTAATRVGKIHAWTLWPDDSRARRCSC